MSNLRAGEVYFNSDSHPLNGETGLYLVLDADTRYRTRRGDDYPVPEYEPTPTRSGKVLVLHLDSRRDWFDHDVALLRDQADDLMRTRTGRYGRLQKHGMWVLLVDRYRLSAPAAQLNAWYDQIPQVFPDNDTIDRAAILWELQLEVPAMITAEGDSPYGKFLTDEAQPQLGLWITRARAEVTA